MVGVCPLLMLGGVDPSLRSSDVSPQMYVWAYLLTVKRDTEKFGARVRNMNVSPTPPREVSESE